jgi:PTH2 family peptidyl-tRNA hydrolase
MTDGRQVKQIIIINRGTVPKMRRGKEIAQGAHASMAWLTRRLNRETSAADGVNFLMAGIITPAEREWLACSFRKVVCQAPSADALRDLCARACDAGLEAHLITDAGTTEFGGQPVITALAIGPDWDDRIDPVTSGLELY